MFAAGVSTSLNLELTLNSVGEYYTVDVLVLKGAFSLGYHRPMHNALRTNPKLDRSATPKLGQSPINT